MLEDYEHKNTERVICPNCGDDSHCIADVDEDGWDECQECGTAYEFSMHVEVTYSTRIKDSCIICEDKRKVNGEDCPLCLKKGLIQ